MERALSIIEPPKKIKESIGWETMARKEKNIMRLLISGMELLALSDLALFANTKYIAAQNKSQKDAAKQLITDIQQKPAIFPGVARLHEAVESSKTLSSYQVSNAEELTKAIADINLQNSEVKDSTKYEIQINGEIRIEDQIDIKAQGKQESEINKYFDTNCGLLLPEGVSLEIIGSDPSKDKLILSTQKIGIYGQNLGEITFSNLTIERRGPLGAEVDQPIDDQELLRSLIYLTTKNDSIVTSRANINNVVLLNSVLQKREGEYKHLLYSGMTFTGFQSVDVQSANLKDFYWDGIAAFGGRYLTVKDSTIKRDKENYLYNVGAAIAIIPGHENALLTVNNSSAENYLKYFGAYGPFELSSSISLTDVTTLNEIESAHYIVTFADSIYMERVKSEGLGSNILVMEGMKLGNRLEIIDSSFVIRRNSAPVEFKEPNNVFEIVQNPKTKIQNSSFDIDNISISERDSFHHYQIAFTSSPDK